MLEIKNTVREIRMPSNEFITRFNRAQERISDLEDKELQTEKRIKEIKPQIDHPRTVEQVQTV